MFTQLMNNLFPETEKQKYHPVKETDNQRNKRRKKQTSKQKNPKKTQINKQKPKNKQEAKNKTSYPLPHGFTEDNIWYNIAQMRSKSKAYIPCILVITIK